jgi:hypothetical protein
MNHFDKIMTLIMVITFILVIGFLLFLSCVSDEKDPMTNERIYEVKWERISSPEPGYNCYSKYQAAVCLPQKTE